MADNPESIAIGRVLDAASRIFAQVLNDVEPYNAPIDTLHMLFFRRLTEWQCAYCQGIRRLYDSECFQGALPVLRSLFEVSVAQVLLHQDRGFREMLELLAGERLKTGDALKKINWPAPQNDIYARLSGMTHVTRGSAYLGRTVDFGNEPLSSLLAQQDIAGVAHVLLWQAAPEDEETRRERWTFIALNAFDFAISSLFTLYGDRGPEREWWNRTDISLFEDLAEGYPAMKQELLWHRLPWKHSKWSRLERTIDSLLKTAREKDGS